MLKKIKSIKVVIQLTPQDYKRVVDLGVGVDREILVKDLAARDVSLTPLLCDMKFSWWHWGSFPDTRRCIVVVFKSKKD